MTLAIELTVNGRQVSVNCPANTTLVELIRDHLQLTGTHVGCDTSQCGACTVHMNGRAVKACTVLALQAQDAEILTIEGLGSGKDLHPMQESFRNCHGLQCGFCTPGMIMAGIDLVNREPDLDEQKIREGLEGNICRCTGYHNIVRAIAEAAPRLRES